VLPYILIKHVGAFGRALNQFVERVSTRQSVPAQQHRIYLIRSLCCLLFRSFIPTNSLLCPRWRQKPSSTNPPAASWQQQQQAQQQQAAQQQAVQGRAALLVVPTLVLLLVTARSTRRSLRRGQSLRPWGLFSRAVRLCGELTLITQNTHATDEDTKYVKHVVKLILAR
jgi:hypothetical protein